MSAGEILLWIIFPYAAVTTFVVGTWWRYRADQFGWTSGSTQLFEQEILCWAGPAFHYGALAAVGGHRTEVHAVEASAGLTWTVADRNNDMVAFVSLHVFQVFHERFFVGGIQEVVQHC